MKDLLAINTMNKEWYKPLKEEFEKPYFKDLEVFLNQEAQDKNIFPKLEDSFAAFNKTPLSKVRVVILGQDPYHGPGQAHGLSFSVPKGIKIPPSLRNIFKELAETFPKESFLKGDLTSWAEQGVFLLNSVLTVEESKAASHKKKGWETFTDSVLRVLNKQPQPIVFLLWGAYAHKKAEFLSNKNHLVLHAPHPSPLSAHRGFLGCGHFKKAQSFLAKQGGEPINWGL
ncbi:MAG: uracil-DNA glycosylase [Bdellovibrionales bacterium]